MNVGFITLAMVTGGAFFLASRSKKKKPAISEHSADDIVMYDLYPDGVAAEQVLFTPTHAHEIVASPDCSTIAVGHDWWEQVAKPMALKLQGAPDEIALQIFEAELSHCAAAEPTDAINQMYDDLIKAVASWTIKQAALPEARPKTGQFSEVPPASLGKQGG